MLLIIDTIWVAHRGLCGALAELANKKHCSFEWVPESGNEKKTDSNNIYLGKLKYIVKKCNLKRFLSEYIELYI
ncbi:MAG: hypothetical protein N2B06_15710 [Clostridium sp.]